MELIPTHALDSQKCPIQDCEYKVVPGTDRCPAHTKQPPTKAEQRNNINLLNIAKWQVRLAEQKSHAELKTLHNEIGVLRILIEEKINKCKDSTDLVIHAQGISDLVMKVNSLVISAQKLDMHNNQTLSRIQVEAYTNDLISILSELVAPEVLQTVSERLSKSLAAL